MEEEELLELISGYPRVVGRWTPPENVRDMASAQDLVRLAEDANTFPYPEFARLLSDLPHEERSLGIRLALLPGTGTTEEWAALRPAVLQGLPARKLDALLRGGVLEASSPPSYGHAKRLDAALSWFTEHCHEEMAEIAEPLVLNLAREVHDLTPRELPYAEGLSALRYLESALSLSPLAQAVCKAGHSVMGGTGVDVKRLLGVFDRVSDSGRPLYWQQVY